MIRQKILISSATISLVLMGSLFTPQVSAGHSITTCTNSCVITTYPNGIQRTEDCCGGRVRTVYPNHPVAPEAPGGT